MVGPIKHECELTIHSQNMATTVTREETNLFTGEEGFAALALLTFGGQLLLCWGTVWHLAAFLYPLGVSFIFSLHL